MTSLYCGRTVKSSLRSFSRKKAALKKFTISIGNTCVGVTFKKCKKRPQNRCFLVNIAKFLVLFISRIFCERLLFDFFDGLLLNRPKGSRSRLHDGVRLQCLTRRSSFLSLSRHEPSPSLRPVFENLRRIPLMNQ